MNSLPATQTTDTAAVTESVKFIPLAMLAPGDDAPGGSINVRKSPADKASDEQIKASILAEGVIQSVLACQMTPGDDILYVAAGNRRLRLCNELLSEGKINDGFLIPAIIKTGLTTAQARALSLAENIARAPLHPVDRYEAFKQHKDDGMSEADIAARYAMSKKTVKQALALGGLSPKVRELWRDGKIDAGVAQTFTLGRTHEAQDAALARVGRNLQSYSVREALVGGQQQVGGLLKLVGKKSYEAAGGSVVEDLFGDGRYVSDPALLQAEAGKIVKAECDKLLAEGWSWAALEAEVGTARYSWRRIEVEPVFTKEQAAQKKALAAKLEKLQQAEDDYDSEAIEKVEAEIEALDVLGAAAGYTPEQMAKAGCVVSLDHRGDISIDCGYVKPGDVAKLGAEDATPADKAKAKKKKEAGGLSEALANRLTEQLTVAAGRSLSPDVAFAALLAGFVADTDSPVRVSSSGMGADHSKSERFAAAFPRVLGMKPAQRADLMLKIVSGALDLRLFSRQRLGTDAKAIAALVDAIPAKEMNADLRRVFDAKDYFDGANKTLCLAAIEEAISKDEARKVAGKPKGEIAKFAITNVPKTGWLPTALRTAHYDGPGAKAKPAKRKGAR